MFVCESLNEFKLLEHKIGEYSAKDEYGDFVFAEIFKNPIDLSGFKSGVRGISDLKGNLYIINDSKQIHKRLLDFLFRKGIITNASWNKINYCYDNIICWQRKQNENILMLGESYLHANFNNIENFDQMLNNVKIKNPNIEFVKNCIINESTSPFKPKSYEELLQSLTAVAPLYVKIFTELFPDKKITMWNEVGHIYAQYNFDILNLRFNFYASYYDYNYKPLISFTIIEKDIIPTYYERTQINNKYQLIDFVNKWSNLDKSIQENKLKHNITYKEVYNLFYKNVDNVYSAKDIAKQYTQLKLHKLS